jgi:hypothetical protein
MPEEGENKNEKWNMVTGNGKTNKLLNPKPKPKLHNAFAILSQPGTPTYYSALSPAQKMDKDRTIIPPSLREHRRQQNFARCQHIKQTLRWLHKSDDLFLNNSITHAKDKYTAIAKSNTNNAKHVEINSAHAQRNQPTIGVAQCGCNTAYRLGFAFNWTIKKLNKKKMSALLSRTRFSYLMPLQPLVSC